MGLIFDPNTRTLSGTPTEVGVTTLNYGAIDLSIMQGPAKNFTITVSDGLALTAPANQNYTRGTAITDLQLPVATGSTGTLTYTLTGQAAVPCRRVLTLTPAHARCPAHRTRLIPPP